MTAEREAGAHMLYEATPAMLHSIDALGRLLAVSDTWLQRLGYRRDEVIGRPAADFLTPESARKARDIVLPAFVQAGRCDDIAYQMVHKDGSVIDVLLSAVLERDAQGQARRSLAVVRDVTERNAAASLSETTHMLQLVLDSLPARISYWDVNGLNRFANRAFLAWCGLEQADITGRHAREVLGDAAYARMEDPIADSLAGLARQVEASGEGPQGDRRITDMRFTPDLRDGQVRGVFVFAIDITAQRQAERDLVDRERRFKLIVEGVRDYAIYMLDPEGRVETWNPGAERSKGYRADQVIGRSFSMFYPPEDVAQGRPQQALARAAQDGRFEFEGWRMRGDGSRFWAGVLLSTIRDEQHELIGFAKITRDLTEQRRQQVLLEQVFELAPFAMLMIDASGSIVMVNAKTETMFGYSRGELIGHPVEMLVPQRWRAGHVGMRKNYLGNASPRPMGAGRELLALRRNGEELPVEIGLSPIDYADGMATLAAVFDISERRRQQAATEHALAEKETLLKEVYHRVKNNLQVIQSLLNLQRQTLPDGQARDAIHDSAQRVRAMALVHEKLYQGNLAAISLPGYTRDLLAQIAEAHGHDRARVRLHADIADIETGLDSAVPYGLLLTELITNCFKHAFPAGRGGEVRVTLARQADGTLLSVADDGVGTAPALDASGDSTSLGLKLADSLARQLGGTLSMRSDGGTVFSALLTRL